MPIYEFICEENHECEMLIKVDELTKEHLCPICGKELRLVYTGDYKIRFEDRFSEGTRPRKLV